MITVSTAMTRTEPSAENVVAVIGFLLYEPKVWHARVLKCLISLLNKITKPACDSNLFIKSKLMILLMIEDSLINFNCRYKVSFLKTLDCLLSTQMNPEIC